MRRCPAVDVLVIDDGSSDARPPRRRRGRRAGAAAAGQLGYGAALQTGYKYAVRHGYDIVAQMDADGQHHRELPAASCSRWSGAGGSTSSSARASWTATATTALAGPQGRHGDRSAAWPRAIMRQHVSDPTSGYQVMRIDVARFFCTDVYPADYPDADILILLHRSGFRVREVGVQMRMPTGKSMHSGHRSLYYVYKMSCRSWSRCCAPRAERA